MRVAIIGAGVSGLSAIKACLESDLDPVCFERSGHIGGLWRYREEVEDGQGSVMKSTVINTSKEMMSFSDFPVPEHFSVFMHNIQVRVHVWLPDKVRHKVYEYFKLYAENFHLLLHIRYNTEVVLVRRAEGFVKHGKWTVDTRDRNTQEVTSHVFDAVMVCTGHHAYKYQPRFPGMNRFQGKVYLSTRRGTWIMSRVSSRGLPLDMLFTSRCMEYLKNFPWFFWLLNRVAVWNINKRIDHDIYCLRPSYDPFQQNPNVNDDLPNRIICGSVVIKTDVKKLTENGVEFLDGSKVDNVDVIVSATGYSFGFPFIDKEVIDVQDNEINLYLNTFLPDEEHQTMAVIGCVQGFASITPATEMQTRAACRVFTKKASLPCRSDMWKDIDKKKTRNAKRIRIPGCLGGHLWLCPGFLASIDHRPRTRHSNNLWAHDALPASSVRPPQMARGPRGHHDPVEQGVQTPEDEATSGQSKGKGR